MANVIKGITVEIGGNTTKLGQAIADSEKKSRALQNELRQVENLLKFDPTNVELLSQKQEILTKNVDETSKKLDTLKEAEKQVTEQFKRGEASEEQVRALQREIIKTEGALGSMKSELTSTEKALKDVADGADTAEKHTEEYRKSVEDAKNELEEFKGKASDAFDAVKTGATVVAGAAVAVGGYALKVSTDFDKAFNTLVTKTGASAEEMDSLNESMERIYANNFGEDIEDVANSLATVKANTSLVGEELEKTTEYAILFRDTFGFEVEESTRSAKMMMDQFGLSASEAYDLMAQGAQNGLNRNGDLMDVINEYSVHFEQLGFDATEMFNVLKAGADSGAFSVDKVGDAFKEFGIRVKDESDATKEAFKSLGLNANETSKAFAKGGDDAFDAYLKVNEALVALDDPLKQNQIGVALYGTMWEDLGATVIAEMANFGDEFNTFGDTLESVNEIKYDDIGSALGGLKRTLETDVINPLGEELLPTVENLIGVVQTNAPQIKETLATIVDKVGEFIGWIANNGETVATVVAAIGAGFVAWKVAGTINEVVGAVKAYKLANEGASVAQALLNGVMNANPAMLIATAIAAVVTAIVVFIATNEDAQAKIVEIWGKIKEVASNVWGAIVTFFTETIPQAIESMVAWFKSLPEKIQAFISQLPSGFQLVVQNIKRIFENMVTIFRNYFGIVKTVVKTAIDVVKAIFSGDFSSIPGIVSKALGKIREYFANILDAAQTIVVNAIAAIINYFRGMGQTWIRIFNDLKSKLSTWWSNLKTNFVTFATNTIAAVVNYFKQLPSKIYNAVVGAIAKLKEWGSQIIATVRTAISNMVTNAVNTAKNLPSSFKTIGKNVIEGIKNGITGAVSGLYKSIKNALSGLVTKAKEALQIRSPSRLMENEVGKNVALGIAKGIENYTAEIKKAAAKSAEAAVVSAGKTAEATGDTVYKKTKDYLEKIEKAQSDYAKKVKSVHTKLGEDIKKLTTDLEADIAALWDAYDKAVADRAKSLAGGFGGIFDAFESETENTTESLLEGMKSQLAGLTEWSSTLDKLGERIDNADFMAELRNMGVDATADIALLNEMSDAELTQFVDMWQMKMDACNQIATSEMAGLKDETIAEVAKLRTEFSANLKELAVEAAKELVELKSTFKQSLSEITADCKSEFRELAEKFRDLGKNAGSALADGLKAQSTAVIAAAAAIAQAATEAASAKLDIHSPSRVFRDIGNMTGEGLRLGILDKVKSVVGSVSTMTQQMTGAIGDPASALNAATLNRQLGATFSAKAAGGESSYALLSKLDSIYDRLNRLQIVLDTGTLVGETLDKIDAGLANKQLLSARGV